jgi:hypothetical protein
MKKIGQIDYKGFTTEFFILPKTKEFLESRGISGQDILNEFKGGKDHDDYSIFYETYLFRWLFDDHKLPIDYKQYSKRFKVIFNGATEGVVGDNIEKVEDNININNKHIFRSSTTIYNEIPRAVVIFEVFSGEN